MQVTAILEVRKVSKFFGGLAAINNLNLDIFDSEILGLIGPNGAGKTTLFNIISGFYPLMSGNIIFKKEDITGLRADQIAKKGISRTFQISTLFMRATVFENVFIGFHLHYKEPGWKAFFHTPAVKREEWVIKQKVEELLDEMGLTPLKDELAINLPHGHQRILGVCIALACNPKLLLLDEPLTGMNPTEKFAMIALIRKIRDRGITIVVVEHDVKAVMRACGRIVVLNHGEKIAEGSPGEIMNNKKVIEAYIGREEEG